MRPHIIFLISWLIPGSGHALQKRYWRATIFFTGIALLLLLGVMMEGKFYDTKSLHPLLLLGFLGDLGNGIFFFIISQLGWAEGNIRSLTYNYGTTYLAAAGLINYLVALNAFDIAKGRKK
jgi:hypothetical protein